LTSNSIKLNIPSGTGMLLRIIGNSEKGHEQSSSKLGLGPNLGVNGNGSPKVGGAHRGAHG
jgi:hypothetical protein